MHYGLVGSAFLVPDRLTRGVYSDPLEEELPVTRMTSRSHAAAAALTLGAAVTLAACSSGSSASGPATTSASGSASGAAASSASASAASTQSQAAGKTIRLGFSPLSLSIPGLQDTANALKAAGKGAGMSVTVADPSFDVQTQVQQLEQWIQLKQVDAIWVIPIASAAIEPVIKQAQAAHIPILIDSEPTKAGYDGAAPGVSFSSTNFAQFGADLGSLLQKCAQARLGGAPVKVIYETDPTGQSSNADTDAAVKAAIAKIPGASIAREVGVNSQLAAQQSVASALQAVPDANAALGTNDEAILGAMQAFQQAGQNPAKSCIIGGGSAAQSLAAIKAGSIYAGVAFDFTQDVKNNVGEILAMTANPTAVGKVMTLPIDVIAPR
jgi:ribose transport system substrate-binding protein